MNYNKHVITTIIMLMMCGTASAWLSGYDHRMPITVNNGGASQLTDYQFNFTNNTNTLVAAGHMQASGADCRITDSSDNPISFWNETAFNAVGTKIHAKASTLVVGDNTFYIYYGNTGASSVANGVYTFIGFDDFEDGNVGEWTLEEVGSFTAATTLVKSGTYSGKYDTATQQVEAYFGKGLGAAIDDYGLPFQSTGIGYDSVEDVLWHGNFNNMTVMKHQKDGTFISELSVDIQGIQGVTHDSSDDSLWAASYWNNTVYNFHKNGTMVGVNITGVTDPTGISYEAATDSIWVQSFPTTLYHYHASNGTELENFSIPTVQYLDGCAYDDQDDTIWQLDDGTTHSVRHYFAGNMTFIESFAIANDAEDLTIDTTDHTMYRDVDPSAIGHTYHVNIDVMTAYSKIVYEWDAASHLTNTYAYFLIEKTPSDIANSMCIMFFNDAQIEYYDGSHNKLRSYSGDIWYHFKAIMDCPNDTYDLYIDDVLEADNGGTWGSIVGGVKTISIQSITPSSPSYIDNLFMRKYAIVEPASSLGAEEDAGNNIALGANKYGMLRKDVNAAQTFSTIAGGFTHDICFTWWDDVTDTWMSYWVGDTYNSAQSIPEHESYFVLMDDTGETVSCSVASAETVAIPIGWSVTYLREFTSKTLSDIKTDMGGNCNDLYAWDHTVSGTGSWNNTGAFSVLPNQGLLVNASAGFNWDGAVP